MLEHTQSRVTSLVGLFVIAAGLLAGSIAVAHPKRHDHRAYGFQKEMKIQLSRTVGRDGRRQFHIDFVRRAMGYISGHGVKFYLGRRLLHINDNVHGDSYDWQPRSTLPMAEEGDRPYLVVNVCDHHDHIGVATMYLDGSLRSSSLGLLPVDQQPMDYLSAADFDFTLRGVRLGCCGHGAFWSDGPIGSTSVRVDSSG